MKMFVALGVMVFVAVAAVGVGGAQAQGLEVGDIAPAFSLPGSDGKTHSLSDYSGTAVVLAWFPKAFTGG
jgi:peroxiredoxin Q/BCP